MIYIPLFAISFLISFFATPKVMKLAEIVGAIDMPKGERKLHDRPIPLMGGLSIAIGFFMTLILWLLAFWAGLVNFDLADRQLVGMIFGVLIIVVIGIIDDIHPISAKARLLFQVLAAFCIAMAENKIEFVSNPFSESGMIYVPEVLSIVITVIWIVGVTNAINLIDGLDGLAASISSVSAISLFIISVIRGDVTTAIMLAALAGATLGFLPKNFHPAKIFMGSTGAYLLGFLLAVISVTGAIKAYATISLVLPILVLGLPIFDTVFAIFRRLLSGKSFAEADRGHIHHRLIDMGLSHRQSVVVLITISSLLGVVAILLTDKKVLPSLIVIVVTLISVFAMMLYLSRRQKASDSKNKVVTRRIKEQ